MCATRGEGLNADGLTFYIDHDTIEYDTAQSIFE
jgi:hypothetical protein